MKFKFICSIMKGERKINSKKEELRRHLIKTLMKEPVRKVKFSGNRITLEFYGHKISDKITIKREKHVAEWSRKRREIFIDKKFGRREIEKSFRALCVHEAIEKFLVEHLKLELDEEAHVIATQKEKEYIESIRGNWRSHTLKIFWAWHKMGEK